MDVKRAKDHVVPMMQMHKSKPGKDKPPQRTMDDIQAEQAILESLNLDRQTDRAFSKTAKGKLQIPHTVCWDRFYGQPLRHVLQCGHVVVTKSIMACGTNCLTPRNAKHQHGAIITCQRCIERKTVTPFIPKKRTRRNTMPSSQVNKMLADDNEANFIKSDESDDMATILQQLERAGYPGHGTAERRKSIFEPAVLPNPLKRRAKDEPAFTDRTQSIHEAPRRKNAIRGPIRGSNTKQPEYVPSFRLDEFENQHCRCHSERDVSMLLCRECEMLYHPSCVGYGELAYHQFLMYESGINRFLCDGCKGTDAEDQYRKTEEKKAKRIERAKSKAKDPAAIMAELKGDRIRGQKAQERREKARRNEILGRTDKAAKSKKKGEDYIEQEYKVEVARMYVSRKATTAQRERRSSAPPPPSRRFSLSKNKFSKPKGEQGVWDEGAMEMDD